MHNTVSPAVYRLNTTIGMHPENQCCDGCFLCRTDTTNRDRKRCTLTGEIIYNARQFGLLCPLEKEEKEDGTEIPTAEG